jgi:hypothetical protein
MNERDILLMQKINSMLGTIEGINRVLFTVKYTQLTRLNLILLKLLLDERKRKGILVVLDRPHQYITHLLRLHNIGQNNISYVDTVSSLSGFKPQQEASVNFVEGPFHLENLLKSLNTEKRIEGQEKVFDVDTIDFIILDNISTMVMYNDIYQIKEFVASFTSLLEKYDSMFLAIAIDKNSHRQLYELIKQTCDKEIEIMEEW